MFPSFGGPGLSGRTAGFEGLYPRPPAMPSKNKDCHVVDGGRVQGGEVLGNLRERWEVPGKIREYWGY